MAKKFNIENPSSKRKDGFENERNSGEGIKKVESENFIERTKEIEIEGKPVSLEIFYTAHVTSEDFAGLREKAEEADIVVIEDLGWEKSVLKKFQEVSDGKKKPQDFFHYFGFTPGNYRPFDALLGILDAIYNTKKQIVIVDVPSGHKLEKEYDNIPDLVKELDGKTKEEKIEGFRNYLVENANFQIKRENLIINNLKKLIENEIKNSDKEEKILMILGSFHSRVYIEMKKSYDDVARDYPASPYIFDFVQESKRRAIFEKDISDSLIARAIVQWYFEAFIMTTEKRKQIPIDPGRLHHIMIESLSDDVIDEIISIPAIKKGVEKLHNILSDK